jgi:hypothetical protein
MLTMIKIAALIKLGGFAALLYWRGKTARRRRWIRAVLRYDKS